MVNLNIMELTFNSLDSSNLTKAQLAEILFEQLGLNKREAKDFIDAFFEIISAQLTDGQDVRISGFVNLPLFDVPLSHFIMRPSIAVPRPSVFQTASD